MGILDWVDVPYEKKPASKLKGEATRLLKKKGCKKKQRRGSGIKKKTAKQLQHEKNMELYRKQKHERGEMFKQFERLIEKE